LTGTVLDTILALAQGVHTNSQFGKRRAYWNQTSFSVEPLGGAK
jgi:hypothetical protein